MKLTNSYIKIDINFYDDNNKIIPENTKNFQSNIIELCYKDYKIQTNNLSIIVNKNRYEIIKDDIYIDDVIDFMSKNKLGIMKGFMLFHNSITVDLM